ncbi:LysR family transcriptional regulator [Pseudoalteromonas denitrificans]|uniref:DNA-binding transcriptional regulator, LysR family n=1 Tax=Pseudoalteromonas denitrificans DSM 6059 TaxID=1123010 RepID=A0A1I1NM26_9GAMM|nr:LysR family transcriptional regulator [Pseudoalteromonas denitrificans]SFC98721.1 DNA-binding transcriptional regulator, LysR family [Pseudoalteromonas denitrificans DSM 6059]
MQNNDLNQIRIFIKVAQLKSFTKAAEFLGIEKSTVSSKISQLENRLGIRLLQRTTRSVSMTEAGVEYLGYCEQALHTLQMGDNYIAELSHTPTGRLKVCAPHNLIDFIMGIVITPFLQEFPKVELEIIQSNKSISLIEDNYDVLIQSQSEQVADSSFVYRKIYHSEWILVASKEFIELHGLAKTPDELKLLSSVGLAQTEGNFRLNNKISWNNEVLSLKHRFSINNMTSIILAIKAGLGFGIVPKKMVSNEMKQGILIEINDKIKVEPSSLYVVYPTRAGQPEKTKAFVEALVKWGDSRK